MEASSGANVEDISNTKGDTVKLIQLGIEMLKAGQLDILESSFEKFTKIQVMTSKR